MTRTRIKMCGISRPEDAAVAARVGADAIGMVFHPASPRNITPNRAMEILAALPAFVTPVALFVDAPTRRILDLTDQLGIKHVQLHGEESPQQVAELASLTVLKAVRVHPQTMDAELRRWREAVKSMQLFNLKGLVLETAATIAPGGTGIENDWATIADRQRSGAFEGLPPIIAAGGLRPDNVAAVVRALNPWAVDVSSGIESGVGHKSEEKMIAFASAVRGI